MLPLSISAEASIKALMNEASQCLNSGKLKQSYELYIKALLSAVKEFKQLEFINQYAKKNNLSTLFSLAVTCIEQTKSISSLKQPIHSLTPPPPPPPIPPKPMHLTTSKSPPRLPTRPAQKKSYSFSDTTNSKEQYHAKLYPCSEDDDDNSEVESEEDKHKQTRDNKGPHRPIKVSRRSSVANLSTSAPSSPIHTAVSNPLNVVKSFLSLPGSIVTHSSTTEHGLSSLLLPRKGTSFSSGSALYTENSSLDADETFLLVNGTVNPNQLVHAQTSSNTDSLYFSNKSNSTYLPMIPQAPLVTVYQSLQKKLKEATDPKNTEPSQTATTENIQSLLNKVQNIHISATTVPTILQFQPVLIAYQLTLIDSAIFRNIPIDAILSHAPKTPHPAIVASTDFFNYLTRLIEHSILLEQEACRRAQQINHWIKVANKCHELKNYQTLKAVISALGTPPIQHLKRSWAFIPKKSMVQLEELGELMSEASNYGRYRERLGLSVSNEEEDEVKYREGTHEDQLGETESEQKRNTRKNSFSEPTVPFLGIFIHDVTYLVAAISKKKQQGSNSWKKKQDQMLEILKQDNRVSELLKLFKNFQRSPSYSPNLTHACLKDLYKTKRRKISQALARNSPIKKVNFYLPFDDSQLSIELQQCLVTQYLLTRSWVSEKAVDELSLVREPTKTMRSYSATESLSLQGKSMPCENMMLASATAPPVLATSISLTTSSSFGGARSSSGSLTSGGTMSSNNSRPVSLEDDEDKQENDLDKKMPTSSFWLFGRKSVDNGHLNMGTMQRSPRHFSFDELNESKKPNTKSSVASSSSQPYTNTDMGTFRIHREGSQGSLSIFRKDFWKSSHAQRFQTDSYQDNGQMPNILTSPHPLDNC